MRSFISFALAALLPLASARQFAIGEVQAAVDNMLSHLHANRTYDGPAQKKVQELSFHPQKDAASSYWYANIQHQGISPYGPSGYTVFRNVMDYGATGNGVTDDTAAIQSAIASGGRCGRKCASSTTTPAVVYFPAGTYLVANEIFDYYNTMLVGDPTDMPTIKASADFNNGNGGWIIDGDPYFGDGPDYNEPNWIPTNVFFRQVKNLILDTTAVPASISISGIHWPTAQSTSLQNMVFNMNAASGTQHIGVYSESGSAGFMSDLTFNGGNIGLDIGNQQFTIRGLTFNNVQTAIKHFWDWGFTYSGLSINNCGTGIDISAASNGALQVGSLVFIDSSISNTPVAVKTGYGSGSTPEAANTMILENIQYSNVGVLVQNQGQTTLNGGSGTLSAWGQGSEYTPSGPTKFEGSISAASRSSNLLSGSRYFTQSKPSYSNLAASSFISARSSGATGNGQTDDTTALQNAINSAVSQGKVLFVDAGIYMVSNTIKFPPGLKIVGEAYSTIMSYGSTFTNINSPVPVVQVGTAGQSGSVEWSDMLVSTQGAQAGATLIEWNLNSASSPSGMWDVHTRVGGADGTDLQVAQCEKDPSTSTVNTNCIGAFMHMHITSSAAGVYMENNWLWTADHDIDNQANTQLTVYSGRGLLIESAGPTWLWGTAAEHSSLYQYQLNGAENIFAGFVQTETPYYQPSPDALTPFSPVSSLNDPDFATSCSGKPENCKMAWGFRVYGTKNMFVYGGGFYSFFSNYDTSCSSAASGGPGPETCQQNLVTFRGDNSNVLMYCVSTVGTPNIITSVDGEYDIALEDQNTNVYTETVGIFYQP